MQCLFQLRTKDNKENERSGVNRKMNKEREGFRRKKIFSISALFLFFLTFRRTVFMIQTET